MYNKFERFDSPNLFLDALKNGISLFCGAGFSILACDSNRNNLPVGNDLLNELKKKFEYVSNYSNLPRACTKIKNSDKGSFYDFLEKRFAVANFDPLYLEILNVNIKSIYTTNIDDLFYKILSNSKDARQLLDRTNGDDYNNDLKIDYYPLHGCIRNNKNYVFGAMEIASAFSQRDNQNSWKQLSKDSARNPILFWGWNFEDSGPIEAMYGSDGGIDNNSKKWVLLYKPSQETVDFLESLNFNIIIGDTISLLKYIHENNELIKEKNDEIVTSKTDKQLKKYSIPNNDEKLTSYSIKSYFLEYTPRWSYVYSNQIPKLKAFNKISEDIASGKDVIVIGMRCSGKTTLMMQLLANNNTYKPKHYLIAPSVNDVETYFKLIGDMQTILFVDDCFRDTNAVIRLLKSKNIQTVLFDRDFNYERQYHKIQTLNFRYIDVTAIEREDSQKIIDSIPQDLKKSKIKMQRFSDDPTILYTLSKSLKNQNFKFIYDFYNDDKEAAKVFLMMCYVNSCGVPCSFDMIYSFLGDEHYTWEDMYNIVDRAGKLIRQISGEDISNLNDSKQDYYFCRSQYLAEQIIKSIPKGNKLFKEVLWNFVLYVPQYKICKYDKFRRSAYDASLISKVFIDIQEGEEFLRLCLERDDSEYIYQQAALYFANNKDYKRAYSWIDKARSFSHYNRFSIDSTYAQIYFDVNINASQEELEKALDILKKCCESDKRKNIHFAAFANRVIKYHKNFPSEKSYEYIENAKSFINEGLTESNKAISQKAKWQLKDIKKKLEQL